MKAARVFKRLIFSLMVTFLSFPCVYSQVQSTQILDTVKQKVIILKNDGSSFTGFIISKDEHELLIDTDNLGRIYIPLHEIKEIRLWA